MCLSTQKFESEKKAVRFCREICWQFYEQTEAVFYCTSSVNVHVPVSVKHLLQWRTYNVVTLEKWMFWLNLKLCNLVIAVNSTVPVIIPKN